MAQIAPALTHSSTFTSSSHNPTLSSLSSSFTPSEQHFSQTRSERRRQQVRRAARSSFPAILSTISSKSVERPLSRAPLLSATSLLLAKNSSPAGYTVTNCRVLDLLTKSLSAQRKFRTSTRPSSTTTLSAQAMKCRKRWANVHQRLLRMELSSSACRKCLGRFWGRHFPVASTLLSKRTSKAVLGAPPRFLWIAVMQGRSSAFILLTSSPTNVKNFDPTSFRSTKAIIPFAPSCGNMRMACCSLYEQRNTRTVVN